MQGAAKKRPRSPEKNLCLRKSSSSVDGVRVGSTSRSSVFSGHAPGHDLSVVSSQGTPERILTLPAPQKKIRQSDLLGAPDSPDTGPPGGYGLQGTPTVHSFQPPNVNSEPPVDKSWVVPSQREVVHVGPGTPSVHTMVQSHKLQTWSARTNWDIW